MNFPVQASEIPIYREFLKTETQGSVINGIGISVFKRLYELGLKQVLTSYKWYCQQVIVMYGLSKPLLTKSNNATRMS